MTPEEKIKNIRQQIVLESELMALRSIIGSLYNKSKGIAERDYTEYNMVFKQFYDHYKADQLSSLQQRDAEIYQKVDDFDWDSYNPIDYL